MPMSPSISPMCRTGVDNMPKVSVIVPVYNVEKYLRKCMDSLVGQTLRDIEIICVDDGSTDGSGAILDEYAAKDPRVKVMHQANAGAGPARNAGLDAAAGKYLFFCDPDDWCDTRMLAKMVRHAEKHAAEIVFVSSFYCEGDDDRVVGCHAVLRGRVSVGRIFPSTEVAPTIFQLFAHVPWNKLLRADFVRAHGLRYQSLPRYNDAYFVKTAMALSSRMSVLRRAYYFHRVRRPGSIQHGLDATPLAGFQAADAVRMHLKETGGFDRLAASWALDVLRMSLQDLQAFSSPGAAGDLYRELRKRVLSDPDMEVLREDPLLNDRCARLLRHVRENADPVALLLELIRGQKHAAWENRRRRYRLVRLFPRALWPWIAVWRCQ